MIERPKDDSEGETNEALGGDPSCWLHLVCPGCGVVLDQSSMEHRPGCAEGRH